MVGCAHICASTEMFAGHRVTRTSQTFTERATVANITFTKEAVDVVEACGAVHAGHTGAFVDVDRAVGSAGTSRASTCEGGHRVREAGPAVETGFGVACSVRQLAIETIEAARTGAILGAARSNSADTTVLTGGESAVDDDPFDDDEAVATSF